MKNIRVLIPDGDHNAAINVARSLGLSGCVTIEIASREQSPPAGYSRHCRKVHLVPGESSDAVWRDAILEILARSPADVILPVSLDGTRMVASSRDVLAPIVSLPPLPDPDSLYLANDKISICALARQVGVAVPPFLIYPDEVPDFDALHRLAYPVLLKHPSSEGGHNIRMFDDPNALAIYLRENADAIGESRHLMQSCLKGEDFGFNALCRDGEILAFTVQKNPLTSNVPFGPAAGIHILHDETVVEAGRRILSALRWNGVANLDMLRVSDTGEMMLLEMNPRYWGTLMGSLLAGVNFPYISCLVALGKPVPETAYQDITYADKAVAVSQLMKKLRGRPHLPGLRFKHTALAAVFSDPMPTLATHARKKWSKATARVGANVGLPVQPEARTAK